jgi:GNAT superfamily N-acetyltransferase
VQHQQPTPSGFEISPLRPAEQARWQVLWHEYQQFYTVELPAVVTEGTWRRIHDGTLHGLGARDASGELMGIVHYLFHEDTWSLQRACYLQDLYVDPRARGAGCARGLIDAVAAAAQRAGANAPYWLTHETNATARRLYDQVARNHGFIQYAYEPRQ